MNFSFSSVTAAAAFAICAAHVPATAQAQTAGGWYAGGSVGQSSQKLRTENVNTPLNGAQSTTDTGYKFLGGYQFNSNFAAEFQYFDLGQYKYADATGGRAVVKTSGYAISGVGIWPVTPSVSLLAKAGLAQQTLSASVVTATAQQSSKTSGSTLLLGVGAEYEINKAVVVRAEYEYFGVPTAFSTGNQKLKLSNNLLSIGLRYRF